MDHEDFTEHENAKGAEERNQEILLQPRQPYSFYLYPTQREKKIVRLF